MIYSLLVYTSHNVNQNSFGSLMLSRYNFSFRERAHTLTVAAPTILPQVNDSLTGFAWLSLQVTQSSPPLWCILKQMHTSVPPGAPSTLSLMVPGSGPLMWPSFRACHVHLAYTGCLISSSCCQGTNVVEELNGLQGSTGRLNNCWFAINYLLCTNSCLSEEGKADDQRFFNTLSLPKSWTNDQH